MNKKSVCRLLGIAAGKWADGLNQGDAPPDQRSGLPTLDKPYDTIAGANRKGGKWLAGMALTAALLGVGGNVFGQDTTQRYANGAATIDEDFRTFWGFTSRAAGSDLTDFASCNLANSNSSEILRFTNFGFSTTTLPSASTIVGVQVQIWKSREGVSDGGIIRDANVSLQAVSGASSNKATTTNWSGTSTVTNYGSATDLWGATSISASTLTDALFGVNVRAQRNSGGGGSREARVHAVRVIVSYTLPNSDIVLTAASVVIEPTTYGTSASNSVGVSGTYLTTNVTATLNNTDTAYFEISKDGSTWGKAPLSYAPASGTLTGGIFHVRTKANLSVATAATRTAAVTFTSGTATAENLAVVYTVNQKGLTVTSLTANNKVYDATSAVTTTTPSLATVLFGDDVTLGGTPTFAFVNANAGTGKTVNRTGNYSLGGTKAGNYSLTQPGALTANITPASVSVTANSASKCFDGVLAPGEVLPAANRYTVAGLLGTDAVANVELASTGFAGGATSGVHPIIPSDLELSSGLITNYAVGYTNGTLTVTDEVKGRISNAANTDICNGSNASINIDQLGGGVPSSGSPFAGVFSIVKDGTTDTVLHAFSITGSPFAVSVPASKLSATSSTTKYIITWKSLDNMTGCSTSSSASLTGSIDIYVYQTPTVAVTGTPAFGTICSGNSASLSVTNPNAVTGAVYDMTANYHGVTGGSYASGLTAHAFGSLTEGTLVNNGNTLDSVTYTFTAKREGTVLCSSTPLVVKYYVQPAVKFDSLSVSGSVVCQEELDATSFTINGLLPNTSHEITFDITGDTEDLGQVATRTSSPSGQIMFSAEEFNGGSPAVGTYTFTLTGLKANGCSKAITTLNAKELTIKPTPTFANVALTNASVCHENLTAETFTVSGLLANKEHTLTFDITGDDTDLGQTATRTANSDGVITFTAADFNGGDPNPGTYTFTLTALEVEGCSLNVTSGNAQTITIKPTPTFDSLSATAASVCVNNLEAETMTIHGLLPSKSHTVSFTVTGEDESGATQTATLPSNDEGTITFDGTAFNGGSPAVGNYTVTITGLEVDGCTLTVPSGNNAESIEIKPTPTITGVSFSSETMCISEAAGLSLNFTGLLPSSADTVLVFVSGEVDGETVGMYGTIVPVMADASGNGTVVVIPEDYAYEIGEEFLTSFKFDISVVGVMANGCMQELSDTLKASATIYNEAKVDDLEVSTPSICADNRNEAEFTINGNFAGGVDYVVNYTVSKGGTIISTDDYTFNLEGASNEINFPASIFAGSSVVPGAYTVEINSVTLNGCIVTFEGETKPSADLELTGTPVVAKANHTIYVGEGCATTMPDYVGTANFTATSCIENFTVEQLAPNAPASAVIGYGGDRTVVFKMTTIVDNGGTVVTYDSIKVHIADTTRPTAIANTTHTVYLNNSGTASLSATAVNNMSTDNCTESALLDLKVSRGVNPATASVGFTCADRGTTQVVTLHVKDASGNIATTTANVSVLDTIRPVITGTMPALTVDKGALCTNELPSYTALTGLTITDNCTGTGSFTVTQSPAAGTIIAKSINSQVVTITVKDQSNNQATTSFTITYEDNTAPVFAGVPSGDVVVNAASGDCVTSVELPNITAMDNCTETVSVISERGDGMEEGSEFALGTTVVNYSATDDAGNESTGSYNIVVNPTIAAPEITLTSADFGEGTVIGLETTPASPCAATVANWPTATLTGAPCESLEVALTESWTIGEGMPVTSSYEFPIGETVVTYTATYTYGEIMESSNATFVVIVSDDAAPILASIEDMTAEVNVEGCKANIGATGMDVMISNTCDEEPFNLNWSISGTELSGYGQISDYEGGIELSEGEYTVTYVIEDASGNSASTSFVVVVTNPLDARIQGTAIVVKNALTTSTVKFTGEGGLAPYTFTYDVYRNDTLVTTNATIATLSGSDAVTIAQSNSAVGVFKYELKSVTDAKGCEIDADMDHILTHTATITVKDPTAVDLTMTTKIIPPTMKSDGTLKDVTFSVVNVGGTATTGAISFMVTKPRLSGCTLTTTSGWTITNVGSTLWKVTAPTGTVINGGNAKIDVACKISYTGGDKGSASLNSKIPTSTGGDTNSGNNSFVRTININ